MARRKRNSSALEQSERRFESICSLGKNLDLGGGITLTAYANVIDDLRTKLADYNTALSTVDKLTDDVKEAERAVKAMAEKMLLGIGSRYGKNSQQYEMAGGSRRRNRGSTTVATSADTLLSNTQAIAASNGSTNGVSPATP